MGRTPLFATAGLVTALAATLPAHGASAQALAFPQSAQSPAATVGEVVVTARRQAERLQDVPLSVTALTAETLQQAGVQNLSEAAALTPGLLIARTSSESGVSPLGGGGVIRGQVDVSGAGNPTVGVFFNGVALPNAYSVSVGILDMERIEVVEGPVSALYGRGAFAGAINYVTRQPSDHYEGHITGDFGNGGKKAVYGQFSGPVIDNVLSLGIAGSYDKFDGTYKDQVNGLNAGGHEKKDFRVSFLFTPVDKVRIFGGYYRGDDNFSVVPQVHADNNCGGFSAARPVGQQFNYYCGEVVVNHPVEVAQISQAAGQTANQRLVQIADLHFNYDLGWATANVIAGFNKTSEVAFQDFTTFRNGIGFTECPINPAGSQAPASATCLPGAPSTGTVNLLELFGSNNNNEDNSVEFRFASRQDQRIRWAVGGYYSSEASATSTLVGLDQSRLLPGSTVTFDSKYLTANGALSTSALTLTDFTDSQKSPFGSLEIDVLKELTAFGEVRYVSQTKTFDIIRNNTVVNRVRPFGPGRSGNFYFTNFRTGLRYKVTNDTNLYFTVATGEKAGGFNQRASIPIDFVYAPETNITYEGGVKTELFEHRLRLNASAFYIKDNGLQVSGPASDPNNPGLITTNYGSTTTPGFELSAEGVVNRMITFTGSFSYVDPKFGGDAYDFSPPSQDYIYGGGVSCMLIPACNARHVTFTTPSGPRYAESLKNLQTPFTSKEILNLGVNFKGEFATDMKWFGRAEYRYESRRFNTVDNLLWVGAHNNIDLSAGLTHGPFSAIAYVNNVTDDQTPLYTFANARLNDFGDVWVSNLPDARQFGIRLTYSYPR